MLDEQTSKYKDLEDCFDVNYKETLYRLENEESLNYKIRYMAYEVIDSAIVDLMTNKKLNCFLKVINDKKSSVSNKLYAQRQVKRHYDALRWFASGEALNSLWFKILGVDVSQGDITKMINQRTKS